MRESRTPASYPDLRVSQYQAPWVVEVIPRRPLRRVTSRFAELTADLAKEDISDIAGRYFEFVVVVLMRL